MSFSSLTARPLTSLPLVLAGPLLRRVTKESVTVWLALLRPASVRLSIHNTDGADRNDPEHLLMEETTPTIKLGENLHVIAVTARAANETKHLFAGTVYFYDLSFDETGTISTFLQALNVSGSTNPLAYAPLTLPSFALPPLSLNQVRIIQGSCRKPHAGGGDALALLDDLIASTCVSAIERPHQLLLTGDQVYVDDVPDVLLPLLTDAGDVLLGLDHEDLPRPLAGSFKAREYPATTRREVITSADFTSDDRRSHLMSFGEIMAMYLFVWSDVLWPADLPTYDDLWSWLTDLQKMAATVFKGKIEAHRKNVQTFQATLPKVRRALANVPSYMTFDDHEVTDDWNMTREFCEKVYDNALGSRIVQNALVAFSICQMWGNTPEQFESHSPAPAGRQLLDHLSSTSSYGTVSPELFTIVGLQPHSNINAQTIYGLYHKAGTYTDVHGVQVNLTSLNYHFTIEGLGHQVLVTDTRTWRSFSKTKKFPPPNQIRDSMLPLQITGPETGDRVLLVVVATNMPPIPGIRLAERLFAPPSLVTFFKPKLVYEEDLFDSWRFPSPAFDRMVSHISDQLPQVAGEHQGRVVLLSGDVHSCFASRMMYWATSRYGVDQPQNPTPAKCVFAQLVCSALRNQSDDTIGQHTDGYNYVPRWYLEPFVPSAAPAGYLGWNFDSTTTVGTKTTNTFLVTGGNSSVTTDLEVTPETPSAAVDDLDRTSVVTVVWSEITNPPHYRYRLDHLKQTSSGQHPETPPPIGPITGGSTEESREQAAAEYVKAAGAYRNYVSTKGGGQDMVGYNNIGEITFTWNSGDDKHVHHTVRWQEPEDTFVRWARYSISLALDDDITYPPLKHPSEP